MRQPAAHTPAVREKAGEPRPVPEQTVVVPPPQRTGRPVRETRLEVPPRVVIDMGQREPDGLAIPFPFDAQHVAVSPVP